MIYQIIELIFPSFCEICDRKLTLREKHICHACLNKIRISTSPFCGSCPSCFKQVWSWGIYEGILKTCIHLIKYKKEKYVLGLLKDMVIEFSEDHAVMKNIDLIVPVPLHHLKLTQRTFNQAYIIGEILGKHYGINVIDPLAKIRYSEGQVHLSRNKRIQNVRKTFAVKNSGSIREKSLLLVDDILTTGATMNECAGTLLKAGAKEIYGFTLARAV